MRTPEQNRLHVRLWRAANPEKHRQTRRRYMTGFNGRFASAKSQAKSRRILWNLTKDQYVELIAKPCAYCEDFFPRVSHGSGLDRLDNKQGYELGNVVSCCMHCNQLRLDTHTPDETRAMVQLLISMRRPKLHVVK